MSNESDVDSNQAVANDAGWLHKLIPTLAVDDVAKARLELIVDSLDRYARLLGDDSKRLEQEVDRHLTEDVRQWLKNQNIEGWRRDSAEAAMVAMWFLARKVQQAGTTQAIGGGLSVLAGAMLGGGKKKG